MYIGIYIYIYVKSTYGPRFVGFGSIYATSFASISGPRCVASFSLFLLWFGAMCKITDTVKGCKDSVAKKLSGFLKRGSLSLSLTRQWHCMFRLFALEKDKHKKEKLQNMPRQIVFLGGDPRKKANSKLQKHYMCCKGSFKRAFS